MGAAAFVPIIISLERGPGGINDEGRKSKENEQGLQPPCIGARRFSNPALRQQTHFSHKSLNLIMTASKVNQTWQV